MIQHSLILADRPTLTGRAIKLTHTRVLKKTSLIRICNISICICIAISTLWHLKKNNRLTYESNQMVCTGTQQTHFLKNGLKILLCFMHPYFCESTGPTNIFK